MACTLIARFLHLHRRPSAPSSTSSPSFLLLGSRPDPNPRASSLSDATTVLSDPDLELWGMMAGEGSSILVIKNLPHNLNLDLLNREFSNLDGFLQTRLVESDEPTIIVFVDFATNADAAQALTVKSAVTVDGRTYPTEYPDESLSNLTSALDTEGHPPSKRRKIESEGHPTCQICSAAIDGPYSKPCRECKQIWCFDCVKTMFVGATHDHERMPAKCCRKVLHHGVAGGILDTVEMQIYKMKYDEFCTSNPLYCPIPICSTFIPPRLMHPVDNKIACHICTTSICLKCKQAAETDHQCPPTDSNIARIKELNYKLCPKCGTGIMKMFGCPHVRCVSCGCHFCWDCSRPINACYKKPCRSAREDGQETENESDNESDIGDETTESQLVAVIPATPQWPADLVAAAAAETAIVAEPEAVQAPPVDPASTEAVAADERPQIQQIQPSAVTEQNGQLDQAFQNTRRAIVETLPEPIVQPATTAVSADEQNSVATVAAAGANEDASEGVLPSIEDLPIATSADQVLLNELQSMPADISPAESTVVPQEEGNEEVEVEDNEDVNLDDPENNDWEGESLDFGDEPEDESWDVWGCEHRFRELRREMVNNQWIRDPEKHLDCMRCFEKIEFFRNGRTEKERRKGKKKAMLEGVLETPVEETNEIGKVEVGPEPEKVVQKGKLAHDCSACGVVYCGACKHEVQRRKKKEGKVARS